MSSVQFTSYQEALEALSKNVGYDSYDALFRHLSLSFNWIGLKSLHEEAAKINAESLIAKSWISVKDRLPEFDTNVLVYYTIGIHEYWEIGRLESVLNTANGESPSWIDTDYNAIDPALWMPLPAVKPQ